MNRPNGGHGHGKATPTPPAAAKPKNSRAVADGGGAYVRGPHPKGQAELIETMNMWAYYLKVWGIRTQERLMKIEEKLGIDHVHPGRGTTHLDPPPDELYTPGPSDGT